MSNSLYYLIAPVALFVSHDNISEIELILRDHRFAEKENCQFGKC